MPVRMLSLRTLQALLLRFFVVTSAPSGPFRHPLVLRLSKQLDREVKKLKITEFCPRDSPKVIRGIGDTYCKSGARRSSCRYWWLHSSSWAKTANQEQLISRMLRTSAGASPTGSKATGSPPSRGEKDCKGQEIIYNLLISPKQEKVCVGYRPYHLSCRSELRAVQLI